MKTTWALVNDSFFSLTLFAVKPFKTFNSNYNYVDTLEKNKNKNKNRNKRQSRLHYYHCSVYCVRFTSNEEIEKKNNV